MAFPWPGSENGTGVYIMNKRVSLLAPQRQLCRGLYTQGFLRRFRLNAAVKTIKQEGTHLRSLPEFAE